MSSLITLDRHRCSCTWLWIAFLKSRASCLLSWPGIVHLHTETRNLSPWELEKVLDLTTSWWWRKTLLWKSPVVPVSSGLSLNPGYLTRKCYPSCLLEPLVWWSGTSGQFLNLLDAQLIIDIHSRTKAGSLLCCPLPTFLLQSAAEVKANASFHIWLSRASLFCSLT